MDAPLPAPAPEVTPETAAFWQATTEGRLLLSRCDDCNEVVWYPRPLCPRCGSTMLSAENASGTGAIYSFTIVDRGRGAYRDAAPFVIAYVELAEGPRVLTNVVGCAPQDVHIGQRVTIEFHDTGAGVALYRFRPAD